MKLNNKLILLSNSRPKLMRFNMLNQLSQDTNQDKQIKGKQMRAEIILSSSNVLVALLVLVTGRLSFLDLDQQ